MMAAKSPRNKQRTTGGLRAWARLMFYAMLGILVIGIPYVAYLDYTVRTQFEGKRWALPARVYARPLELFQGVNLTAEQLSQELVNLGYVNTVRPETPGTFVRMQNGVRLMTRSFRFWDSTEPSLAVQVEFEDNSVRTLRDPVSGAPVDLVRLDPLLIGSIYPSHHEDRVLVQISEVPPLLIKILLTIEDRHFYAHHGIDPFSILRAMWANLRAGSTVQGGSTLTQQLVRSLFLGREVAFERKLNEAFYALIIEARFDKGRILETYLNEVYLGQEGAQAVHGVGAGAVFWFGRELEELDTAELALLVGLIQGPS